jgi:uncharacterized membrane-anchored protein YjiN (DUF445 family)
MKALLIWLVPPCVGALIGYVTNLVAIRMLFRPLEAKRIFGIRLPFTPGILPRQRHKLACNIGAMVERELLTPEILQTRLRREDVRENLYNTVARCTDRIFTAPLSAHGDIIRSMGPWLGGSAPVFEILFDRFFASLAEENAGIRDLLGPDYGIILEKNAERLIRDRLREEIPRISGRITLAAEDAFPETAAAFIRFLNRPEIHGELEVQGRIFLNSAILKLNAVQRFFISAGQYDKTLNERMPEIIDDLIRQLAAALGDEDLRRRLLGLLDETVRRALSSEQTLERLVPWISLQIRSYLDKPLADLIRDLTGGDIRALGRKILGHIKNKGLDPLPFLEELMDRGISLGELFAVGPEKKKHLDSFLNDRLLEMADGQTAAVLRTINIRTLVSDRIDSLDMIRVEGIILDVMAHQLKWINVFGGILGALIGVFQSVFAWVMKMF